ncbi:MAG: NADPH-dependent F420 reductase [Candidatus Promineifilaceae bacterium]
MKIAILGGTGDHGFGLGYRWARAGHEIIIGSRSAAKGAAAAARLLERVPGGRVRGLDNLGAAGAGEMVVLSVPYEAQADTLAAVRPGLAGKLLVSVVAPLNLEKKGRARRPPGGLAAAEEAQAQVGPEARVVCAFQHISADHLLADDGAPAGDVLICGQRAADKALVAELCADAGLRGVNAGGLANAAVVEGLTAVLISINVIHKVSGAGIRVTGLPDTGRE